MKALITQIHNYTWLTPHSYASGGNWNQFRYIFNRAKISDLDVAKKEFQKIFKNNAAAIWSVNPTLMKKFDFNGVRKVLTEEEFILLTKKDDFWKQLEFITFE